MKLALVLIFAVATILFGICRRAIANWGKQSI
jgi:hypothetical protein